MNRQGDYATLLTEQRKDSAAHVAIMRHLRAAAIQMEEAMGGPVEIMEQINTGDGFTITFRRVPGT